MEKAERLGSDAKAADIPSLEPSGKRSCFSGEHEFQKETAYTEFLCFAEPCPAGTGIQGMGGGEIPCHGVLHRLEALVPRPSGGLHSTVRVSPSSSCQSASYQTPPEELAISTSLACQAPAVRCERQRQACCVRASIPGKTHKESNDSGHFKRPLVSTGAETGPFKMRAQPSRCTPLYTILYTAPHVVPQPKLS